MTIHSQSPAKAYIVPASAFKATCLELMDRVHDTGAIYEVTKHGKPVARLVPIAHEVPPLFGSAPIEIAGDIVSPIGEEWDAEA